MAPHWTQYKVETGVDFIYPLTSISSDWWMKDFVFSMLSTNKEPVFNTWPKLPYPRVKVTSFLQKAGGVVRNIYVSVLKTLSLKPPTVFRFTV